MTSPKRLPLLDLSMNLLESPSFDEEAFLPNSCLIQNNGKVFEAQSFVSSMKQIQSFDDSLESSKRLVQSTRIIKPGINSTPIVTTGRKLDKKLDDEMSKGEVCDGIESSHGFLIGKSSLSEYDRDLDDADSLVREMERYRDELYMLSVNNAILMDSLVMAGADL